MSLNEPEGSKPFSESDRRTHGLPHRRRHPPQERVEAVADDADLEAVYNLEPASEFLDDLRG